MISEEFVARLKMAMPSFDELDDYGLEVDEIADVQSKFAASLRDNSQLPSSFSNEILRLLRCYDCSTVEIGGVRFAATVTPHVHGDVFAYCEADPMVVGVDGDICMYDHEDTNRKILNSASTSEAFLSALTMFVQIVRRKSDWSDRWNEAADCCALAAGGAQFRSFFEMILPIPL